LVRSSHTCTTRSCILFFFNDTVTTEISTLSLHDALPISIRAISSQNMKRASNRFSVIIAVNLFEALGTVVDRHAEPVGEHLDRGDRKSTRLNSSHRTISYAVFCLKKKKHKKDNSAVFKRL